VGVKWVTVKTMQEECVYEREKMRRCGVFVFEAGHAALPQPLTLCSSYIPPLLHSWPPYIPPISGLLAQTTLSVEIVMLEKRDCVLSKRATQPYIYEYKWEYVRTHLCSDPSGRQQSPVIRD